MHPRCKIDIDTNSHDKPVHTHPNLMSHIHLSTSKYELDYLVKLGALVPQQESTRVSTSFIIHKTALWISDLYQLNKAIWWSHYHLPIISDTLCKCIGYTFFNKISFSTTPLACCGDSRSLHHYNILLGSTSTSSCYVLKLNAYFHPVLKLLCLGLRSGITGLFQPNGIVIV